MKFKKEDYRNILIIISIFIIYFLFINLSGYVYGSKVDWMSQHFAIPDYLRKLFYANYNLMPNFAFNLGGGENIYYLVYHGVFNPLIMISYLFPFIKMHNYIIILNVIIVLLDIIFIYKWLSYSFDKKICFIGSMLFLLSMPIIYHSHRHLMFTDYMPLLILSLILTRNYFENKSKALLIINLSLIISISYLYSVGCLIVISIYAVYIYLNKYGFNKNIFKEGTKFILILIISVLITSFITLPTFYTLLSGRSATSTIVNIWDLVIPSLDFKKMFYSSYGIGLGVILLYSLLNGVIKGKKFYRELSILLLLVLFIPLFNYVLNGFMYIDNKSLIPFLPMYIYVICMFIKDLFNKNVSKYTFILGVFICLVMLLRNLDNNYLYLFIFDIVITTLFIYIYIKKRNVKVFYSAIILPILAVFLVVNFTDRLITREEFNKIYKDNNIKIDYDKNNYYRSINELNYEYSANNVNDINYLTTSIYSSVENPYYINFIKNVWNSNILSRHYHEITINNDVLFNIYMGGKYLISDKGQYGYNKKGDIYVNDDVFTIGRSSNKLMSKREFDTLSYPHNIDALLNYMVVDTNMEDVYSSNIHEYNTSLKDSYVFNVDNEKNLKIPLDVKDSDILFISFKMNYAPKCGYSCSSNISINGVNNTLSGRLWKYNNKNNTFHYTISGIKDGYLSINVSKGHYDISDIKVYVMDYNTISNIEYDKFIIKDINDYGLKGSIEVNEDGYFALSIPYDKGFTIYDNEKEVNYSMVNTSFIGFPIDKGSHNIEIKYKAPFRTIGEIASIIGIILLLIVIYKERRKK